MSKTKVSIIGGSGFLSAELLRNLLSRDDVELLRVSSKDHIGQNIGQVHRTFYGMSDLVLEDIPPRECVEGADIVVLELNAFAEAGEHRVLHLGAGLVAERHRDQKGLAMKKGSPR